jgi:hypothetical protein
MNHEAIHFALEGAAVLFSAIAMLGAWRKPEKPPERVSSAPQAMTVAPVVPLRKARPHGPRVR